MSIQYRPEIEGLRAVAVIAVIIYHLDIFISGQTLLSGGFLGVDVFFVISGYLISKIIFTESASAQGFSLLNFYERRIRRILPLLLMVIFLSLLAGWHFLLPRDFIELAKSAIASLFFYSNFFFYYATTVYGAESSQLKPLLHTWSLSVEEQFYIFFPLIFIAIQKFYKKYDLLIVFSLSLLSLALARMVVHSDNQLDFYLLPTRIWELLAGTMLALIDIKYGRDVFRKGRQFLPLLGMAILIYTMFSFKESKVSPSFHTVKPILGVCLIIFFSGSHEVLGRLLGSKPFRAIGKISYSLYLWHFPVFAFARVKDYSHDNWDKIGWVGLTFMLSIISYFFVELPYRDRNRINSSRAYTAIMIVFSACAVLATLIIFQKGFSDRVPQNLLASLGQDTGYRDLKDDKGLCHDNEKGYCEFGYDQKRRTVFLIGDSHMDALSSTLYEDLKTDYNFIVSTRSGCLFSAIEKYNKPTDPPSGICNYKPQSQIMKLLDDDNRSIVIYGGRFPLYFSQQYFDNKEGGVEGGKLFSDPLKPNKDVLKKHLRETLLKIAESGHPVILIYPIPETGWDVPQKLMANRALEIHQVGPDEYFDMKFLSTSYEVYRERAKESFEFLDSVKHKNIYRIHPHELFCNTVLPGRCVASNSKYVLYSDDDHPSPQAVEMIDQKILQDIRNIDQ